MLRHFENRKYRSGIKLFVGLISCFFTGKFLHEAIKVHLSADFLDEADSIKSASYGDNKKIDFLEFQRKTIPLSLELSQFVSRAVVNLHLGLKIESPLNFAKEIEPTTITSSSHHMGTVWTRSTLGGYSSLEVSRDIYTAGSSIFQASVPGHPTMLAAATALLAADRIKSQFN